MERSNRVIVKNPPGKPFGVDLANGERFELRDQNGNIGSVMFRMKGDLWILEMARPWAKTSYFAIPLVYAVGRLLKSRMKLPDDLIPTLRY